MEIAEPGKAVGMAYLPTPVADGVFRVRDGLVNWYLLREGRKLTILDTGWPRSWRRIEGALHHLGHGLGDVRAVLLTHGHADHLGAAEQLRRSAGVPVLAHRDEVDRVRGKAPRSSSFALVPGLLPHLWRPPALRFVLHATAQGFLTPRWVEVVRPFDDGEELPLPGRPRAVLSSGHTEGHTSFHLADRGVLIAGDALVTLDPLSGRTGPRLLPDALNSDTEVARASLGRLERLDAELLLPGHGEPWKGSMAKAVASARQAAATPTGPGQAHGSGSRSHPRS